MITILPGILESDWNEIEKKLKAIVPFAQEVHIDLIDEKFAATTTFFDPAPFKPFTKGKLFELHMMVADPLQYLQTWSQAGFKRFIGHVEKIPDIPAFVAEAQLLGEVGLAIDAKTPLESLDVPFDDLDCLLIMTVQAGKSGQKFLPDCLQKVTKLREQTLIPIEVDGGITTDMLVQAAQSGANRFVANSKLFNSVDVQKTYLDLEELADKNIKFPPETDL